MSTLHLVSLPHTQVTSAFCWCAYTSKVLRFCKMLGNDYDIHVYAPEGPDIEGATLHPCLTNKERVRIFGPDDASRLPAWPSEMQSRLFNQHVIERMRPAPHDLILLAGGYTHHVIAEAFPNHITCEPGVGYEGIYARFCAFESYAWMHHVYAKKGINDGRFFDAVIPNFFDPREFPLLNPGKGEYLLFLGRIVQRKGPHIASEIAQACGLPLRVAGAGGRQVGRDIVAPEITVKEAEYLGPVNVKERAELLAGAKALLVPTTYIEPFGGVAVEAMLCGTPVITTDWGAFTETVQHGVTGYRFRVLAEAVIAVLNLAHLNSEEIRAYAHKKYSLATVRPQFIAWFNRLHSLFGKGWYQ
jgi:glycosyltransferase involved in cell wall biosynthesis